VFHNSENASGSFSSVVSGMTATTRQTSSAISTGITHDLSLATTQNQTTAVNGGNTTATYQTTVLGVT
jgi:hypothetical protein